MSYRLDRIGSPKRRSRKKPDKTCGWCGRTFHSRDRAALHRLAHEAAEATSLSVEAAEIELRAMRESGELRREHHGFSLRESGED